MKMRFIFVLFSIVAMSVGAAEEQNTSENATTVVRDAGLGLTIKGNKELPNVLYIVPWRKGPRNDVSPIQGRIVDEVYGPIESHVFERRVKLFRQLQPDEDATVVSDSDE
ncbi:hypothetical protein [Pleionea sediminis]|uniref:hypothetical protein n=1 Tax=Pleionea sediminis TaxID=2569479 RepID=UPI001185B676|nr:hypothetical protein [Pleionea sediminis]